MAEKNITFDYPKFMEDEPALWFRVIDQVFGYNQIHDKDTRYLKALTLLDSKALKKAKDVVTKSDPDYDALKKALIGGEH